MTLPTEELLQQYADDRLALARLNAMQRIEQFSDANLTMHELRVVLLVASGIAPSRERLITVLQSRTDSTIATLGQLVQQGYIEPVVPENDRLTPTEDAMNLFDAMAERRDITMELLANLDPDDLEALVQGTRALRVAMELDASEEGGLLPADTLTRMQNHTG